MIFYLDTNPHKCAKSYAVEHLKSTTIEALSILCDATRLLSEECRVNAMQKKMKDPKANVKPEDYYMGIEENVPIPFSGQNDGIVQWVTEGQDSWDWFYEFTNQLTHEQDDWFGHGCDEKIRRWLNWVWVDSPRPVHAGRIYPRTHPFPISTELTLHELLDVPGDPSVPPPSVSIERLYRRHYYLKYRNSVHFAQARMPWWWRALKNMDERTLASPAAAK